MQTKTLYEIMITFKDGSRRIVHISATDAETARSLANDDYPKGVSFKVFSPK